MLYPLSSERENAVNLIGQIKVISHYPVTVGVKLNPKWLPNGQTKGYGRTTPISLPSLYSLPPSNNINMSLYTFNPGLNSFLRQLLRPALCPGLFSLNTSPRSTNRVILRFIQNQQGSIMFRSGEFLGHTDA